MSRTTLLVLPLLLPALAVAQPTQTSTGAAVMPEDGGPLPRATMPGTTDEGLPPRPKSPLTLEWGGYLRVVGELVQDDALLSIGRNDGFRLGNVRLGLRAAYNQDLYGYVSIDAAVAQVEDADDANADLAVGLRDAYLAYAFAPSATVQLGRFKPPYDLGNLESTSARVFIDEPIESRGVLRTQGIEAPGMGPGRQMGLMLHSPRVGLSEDGFDLGYALAITNGDTGDRVFNDNDHFAGFARVSFLYGDVVTLSAGGFIDTRTSGRQPDLFEDRVIAAEGSLIVKIADLRVEGQFLLQHNDPLTAGTPAYFGFGAHAQWSYRLWGFEPAYRFAWFEPNSEGTLDVVQEHTLGLSYYLTDLPLRVSLNGTFAFEEREVDNHRAALLVQYTF